MKTGPAMEELLAKVKPGRCFCGRPVRPHKGRGRQPWMCGSRRCARVYKRAYQSDHYARTTPLRAVVRKVTPDPEDPERVVLHLECGHTLPTVRCHAKWDRKLCKRCKPPKSLLK